MTVDVLPSATEQSLARIHAWQGQTAMAKWLDFAASLEDGILLYRLQVAERHIGNMLTRALHGGVVSSFLQVCAHMEGVGRIGDVAQIRPISVHCNYLRSAKDLDLLAQVEVVQRGRRIAFLEATCWQSAKETPVARAAVALRLG